MTRQIINISNVHKCHVVATGADAGSCVYEAATAYEAGTAVFYNGTMYCAIVDIEATDTDTPADVDGAEKWAVVLPLVTS